MAILPVLYIDVVISEMVTFDSSSSQFTCISTGGPATTVTWTRDSVTFTEGTETVLNDREEARYTHTLTVTESVSGSYTCFVANNKPSFAIASYLTEGRKSQPHHAAMFYWLITGQQNNIIDIDPTSVATSISLSWRVLSSTVVTRYEATWQRDNSIGCSDEDEGSTTINNGSTSYVIMGLEEDSSYSITVTASNAADSSAVSNTVTAMTEEAGERYE